MHLGVTFNFRYINTRRPRPCSSTVDQHSKIHSSQEVFSLGPFICIYVFIYDLKLCLHITI